MRFRAIYRVDKACENENEVSVTLVSETARSFTDGANNTEQKSLNQGKIAVTSGNCDVYAGGAYTIAFEIPAGETRFERFLEAVKQGTKTTADERNISEAALHEFHPLFVRGLRAVSAYRVL